MDILFLSRWFPCPPNNGSKLRIYNLLRGLAEKHNVEVISFVEPADTESVLNARHSPWSRLKTIPLNPFDPRSLRARLGFLSTKPRALVDSYSHEMAAGIEEAVARKTFGVVIASQIDTAAYRRHIGALPAVFEEAEVGVLLNRIKSANGLPNRLRASLTWAKHRRYLASLLPEFQLCTVVSERERQLIEPLARGRTPVEVIPNCVEVPAGQDTTVSPLRNTIIFSGPLNYYPNYEALEWFQGEILPQIQAEVPEVRVTATGDHSQRSFQPDENVLLTGLVEDVRTLVAASWCSIVPLKTGGGTRLKILESMALGTPVVSTTKGAEGLDVEHNRHLLLADTPETFAVETVRLLRETELRERLSLNAYRLVRKKYNWNAILPRFLELLESVAVSG